MRRFTRGRPLRHAALLAILLLAAPIPLAHAAGTFNTQPAWTLEADQPGARLGSWVAPAGDVNGDGFDDLIVTEYNVDPNHHVSQPIHVLVLAGSPSGAREPAAAALDGFQTADSFGEAASRAGDFDGDGYADLIVGAPAYDHGEIDEGAAFIYRGGPFASSP